MTELWRSACSSEALGARAELYAQLRAFFSERSILEVETPIVSRAGSTDPHLASLTVGDTERQSAEFFLQTSPEFAMKRLLASGSGDIFQICKSFRRGEVGHRHNPEFTMLEWYRVDQSLSQLLCEIDDLVRAVLNCPGATYISYKQAFNQHLSLNPFSASLFELRDACLHHLNFDASDLEPEACLDLLLSHCIEPKLGVGSPCFLFDYPAEQASLARTEEDDEGDLVGRRAELYINGIEIANAYDELTSASEQAQRFEQDRAKRKRLGLPDVRHDRHLIQALQSGMPACAGVALGVDRLLMLKLGKENIQDVLPFPADRA